MREIEWTEISLRDMAALEHTIARRVKFAVERFAQTGIADIGKLRGTATPEYRLRIGDYRARFELDSGTVRILEVRHRREAYR